MQIRPITPADAEAVFHVQKRTWLDTYPNEVHGVRHEDVLQKFLDEESCIAKKRTQIESFGKNKCGWLMEVEGSVVGFVIACKNGQSSQLEALYVLPDHQGKGVGGGLIKEALSFFSGAKEVWLEVAAHNKKAIGFYQRYGFKIVEGTDSSHEVTPNVSFPTVKMKLEQ